MVNSLKDRKFTLEESLEISQLLSGHDLVFKTFWSIGTPLFTRSIKTAAVGFDNSGKELYLILNPEFWDSLDMLNKAFVICHEALHVILNHGKRGNEYKNDKLVNYAQDIVINEMLVSSFGFNKFEISNWDKYCFVETVFSKEDIINKKIHTRGSFHYYMELLLKNKEEPENVDCVDQHSFQKMQNGTGQGQQQDDNQSSHNSPDFENSQDIQDIQDLMNQAKDKAEEAANTLKEEIDPYLSDEEKYSLGQKIQQDIEKDPQGAGSTPFGALLAINPFPVKKKKKWEEIVKKHLKSMLRSETIEVDSWIARKRNHYCLDPELMIEGVWSAEKLVKEKYNIIFFLDSSGSCYSHAKRFVKMLQSIPEDKFYIQAYAFDTRLYPIDLKKGDVHGGGGTSFSLLDAKIREVTSSKRHPDAVFVLSDGDGNYFNPEKPKLWHWILTPRHSTYYIPKESNKHDMSKFE